MFLTMDNITILFRNLLIWCVVGFVTFKKFHYCLMVWQRWFLTRLHLLSPDNVTHICFPEVLPCSSRQQAQCWTVTFPERKNKLTGTSGKLCLNENFVMFALLWVTKYCLRIVFFLRDVVTKSSKSDEFIITLYCA